MKSSLYKIILAGVVVIIGLVLLVLYISLQPSKSVSQLFSEPGQFFTFRDDVTDISKLGDRPIDVVPPVEIPDEPGFIEIPFLEQVFALPVAGYAPTQGGGVRLVQATDGFVYDASRDSGQWESAQRTLTNFSDIGEAFVYGSDSQHVAIRFVDESDSIQTFIGTLKESEKLSACQVSFDIDLARGDRGDQVAELQKFLNEINSAVTGVDGSFGPGTQRALETFQETYDIPVTGILDEITRFVVNTECSQLRSDEADKVGQPQVLSGNLLPSDVTSFTPTDDGIAYVLRSGQGAEIISAKFDGARPRRILEHAFTEWHVMAREGKVFAETKPTATALGFVYRITGRKLQKIAGDLSGFQSLPSPSLDQWLIQDVSSGVPQLFIDDIRGTVLDTELETLVDKCTWSANGSYVFCAVPQVIPQGLYPDLWYQKLVSFEDLFWVYDVAKQSSEVIAFVSEVVSVDARDLVISPDGAWIYFINGHDETLWRVQVSEDFQE